MPGYLRYARSQEFSGILPGLIINGRREAVVHPAGAGLADTTADTQDAKE
jgi:hypothetical protein